MAKALGVGGVMFKSADPKATMAWYARVLGVDLEDWGGAIFQPAALAGKPGAATVFNTMRVDADYLAPSTSDCLINFVVDDLDGVLARCKKHGAEPVKLFPEEFNGRFAHVMDPDGRKIELWEPRPVRG
jgi:predicted enzyme related to lactoylglutathione lyase